MYKKKKLGELILYCFIFCTYSTEFVDSSNTPTLEFRPMASTGSTLIWYKASDEANSQYWRNELDNFLSAYIKYEKSENAMKCEDLNKPERGKFCDFQINNEKFAPCTHDFNYGYDPKTGGLCIFLKLNKIFAWIPDYYNSTTAPNNIPQDVRNNMKHYERTYHPQRIVWVDCAGENPADIENIGPVSYYPQRGFHEKYFPYENVKGYLSPLVAVQFENPQRGVLINIACRAWARNIDHSKKEGYVHLELMIDP